MELTTRHNRHNGLLTSPTCYRLVADFSFMLRTCYGEVTHFLRTYYGETAVMDFGLYYSRLASAESLIERVLCLAYIIV